VIFILIGDVYAMNEEAYGGNYGYYENDTLMFDKAEKTEIIYIIIIS